MKVGDLVKQTMTGRNDLGLVIDLYISGDGVGSREPFSQATIRWSCGMVQYFDVNLLEVLNESR